MSKTRGIFETFANQSSPGATPPPSPFAVAADTPVAQPPAPAPASSPFSVAPAPAATPPPARPEAKAISPFEIVKEEATVAEQPKAVRLPQPRRSDESPFQISEPKEFGFEAPSAPEARQQTPFETVKQEAAPQQQTPPPSPFSLAPEQPTPAQAPAEQYSPPFGGWPQAEVAPSPVAAAPQAAASAPHPPVIEQPKAAAAPEPTSAPSPTFDSSIESSDSSTIKQLELRAIFGVNREMNKEEILQRAGSLPGIREIALVSDEDAATVNALKNVITNLGFGDGPMKLYSGSSPIEFIREGRTILAIQTEGGFAPGVRETLMIVARELSK
ncbi:MAG: hypothetical protein ACSHX9_09190 [Luteolibacter sp.]